jgi:hypothetical protein
VIAYIVPRRGSDIAGLIRYLFGPGRHNEHTDQHVIAAAPTLAYLVPDGHRPDPDEVRELGGALDDYRVALGVEVPGGHVWHCAISLPAGDRALSDREWAQVARAAVDRLGFSDAGGRAPTRWTAVHHGSSLRGNDHIHLVVNLVREDGTRATTWRDRVQMSKVCREFEQRLGLRVIASRAGAGMPGVTRAEIERAGRAGGEPERLAVARSVRGCAVAAGSEADFARRLRAAGLAPRPWYERGGQEVSGYSVSRRGRDGRHALRFGGGKLAPDLTLGRLREHWDSSPAARAEALAEWSARAPSRAGHASGYGSQAWQQAAAAAARAVSRLADVPPDDAAAWAGAARETAGVLAAWSATTERAGPGPLARAADVLAASAQTRRGDPRARRTEVADLRGVAAVVLAGSPGGRGSAGAVILLRQMTRLMEAIHDAHLARGEAFRAAQLAAVASGGLARLHKAAAAAPPVPGPARQAVRSRPPAPGRDDRDNGRG